MNWILRALCTVGLFALILSALALLLIFVCLLGACSENLPPENALYARSAVDARVREFKLRNKLQLAHCTTSHSSVAECSGITAEGRRCRFTCRVDDCEWDGL